MYVNSAITTPSNNPAFVDPFLNYSNLNLSSGVSNATDVIQELETVTSKTSPDTHLIPSIFFLNCKFVLTVPLLYLFNLSLSSGCFSSTWKLSFVTLIYKGNDVTNLINYRPISLISTIPKIFVSIMLKKITPLLTPLISLDQYGFIKDL